MAHHYRLASSVSLAACFTDEVFPSWNYAECMALSHAEHLVGCGVGFWPPDPGFVDRPVPSRDDHRAANRYVTETGSEQPGISVFKLCVPLPHSLAYNRTWIITPSEAASALVLWERAGRPLLVAGDRVMSDEVVRLLERGAGHAFGIDVYKGPTNAAEFLPPPATLGANLT